MQCDPRSVDLRDTDFYLLTLIRPKQLQLWKILCQLCRSCGLQENGAVRPEPLNPINSKSSTLNPQPSTLNPKPRVRIKAQQSFTVRGFVSCLCRKDAGGVVLLNSIPRGSLTTLKKGSSENPQSIYTGFSLNPKTPNRLGSIQNYPP